jgi:hypothetical protein
MTSARFPAFSWRSWCAFTPTTAQHFTDPPRSLNSSIFPDLTEILSFVPSARRIALTGNPLCSILRFERCYWRRRLKRPQFSRRRSNVPAAAEQIPKTRATVMNAGAKWARPYRKNPSSCQNRPLFCRPQRSHQLASPLIRNSSQQSLLCPSLESGWATGSFALRHPSPPRRPHRLKLLSKRLPLSPRQQQASCRCPSSQPLLWWHLRLRSLLKNQLPSKRLLPRHRPAK